METTEALIETNARDLDAVVARPAMAPPAAMTAQQARVDAVAALTSVALSKAATLQLTPEETERLTAEFADVDFLPGAAGKENLIYIQHSALRGRLNSVLGLGQWALVVRESWNEDFTTQKGVKGVRVYVRAMMLVRGCYVAEAVGDMDYFPGNAAQNYGDAFEGSKTAAFRRCAKEFGVGVQAWDRHWCDAWWQRKRGKPAQVGQQPPQPPAKIVPPAQSAQAAPLTTAERKAKLIAALEGYDHEAVIVFRENALILPTEDFRDISEFTLERIQPANLLALIKEVKQRRRDSDQLPDAAVPDAPEPTADEDRDMGVLEQVTAKSGTKKNGKPFTRYGAKISGEWYNTFSDTLGDIVQGLEGQQVRFSFVETKFGKDLVTIEAAGEVTP